MSNLSKRSAARDAPIRVAKRPGARRGGGRSRAVEPRTGAARLTAEERKEIAEIVRLLAEKPREFRLQFLSAARDAAVRDERSVWAIDASTVVGMAADVALPEGATRLRLVDPDGRTVFERQAEEAVGA